MKPRPHQAQFLKKNPSHAILAWEMRVGKSLPAAMWVHNPIRSKNAYILTPKANKADWQAMSDTATVLTKEEFKKADIKKPTAIVVDEAHYFAAALFIRKGKGRSQLAEKLYNLIRDNPNMHVLLLTATPIRQDAWSLHTLLCYIGVYYDWRQWQKDYFRLVKMPFLKHQIWIPKDDWRIKIRVPLEKHCSIVSLRNIIDDLPPIESTFLKVPHPKYIEPDTEAVTWAHEHRYEQTDKYKEIVRLGEGYRKIMVVAYFTEQIDNLVEVLKVHKPVFVLDGRTKDPAVTKARAQEADDCFFIVQSSMGFGFDGWMFSAIVFASMSHKCLDHTQMLGRMRHLDHLHTVPAYYLIGGRWDQRIYNTIHAGRDFNPHEYVKNN